VVTEDTEPALTFVFTFMVSSVNRMESNWRATTWVRGQTRGNLTVSYFIAVATFLATIDMTDSRGSIRYTIVQWSDTKV
jgi:hypothetical protein